VSRKPALALLIAVVLAGAAGCLYPGADVPYVQTPTDVVTEMLKLANVKADDVVYDLGSGDGRIVIAAARDFGARGVGIEIDPSLVAYSRELAPLAGGYPAVRLGAPWWFHDSVEGMTRYLDRVTETAGIDKLAGFVDDTRAFCSIPARHDLARRVQANWLARLVSRHVIDIDDGREMARLLAYELAKRAYRIA
jgi:SAM-dependent methyltransferase